MRIINSIKYRLPTVAVMTMNICERKMSMLKYKKRGNFKL